MCMEEVRNAYTIFIGECEWKRPHGRLWAYILRADFQKYRVIVWTGLNWLMLRSRGVLEVGIGQPASVGGFCPFVVGGLTISFDALYECGTWWRFMSETKFCRFPPRKLRKDYLDIRDLTKMTVCKLQNKKIILTFVL